MVVRMSSQGPISDLVNQAKEAVNGLEEPYRMEAFKIILEKLISDASEAIKPERQNAGGNGRLKTKGKTSQQVKKVRSTDEVKTGLDLSTTQLRELKDFYGKYLPDGGEASAFILSMFLYDILKINAFNVADIEYLYRALISMKVKVPVVSDWKRALNWLCAKSRKKEWLKRNGLNYSITNSGLIAFNDLDKKEMK